MGKSEKKKYSGGFPSLLSNKGTKVVSVFFHHLSLEPGDSDYLCDYIFFLLPVTVLSLSHYKVRRCTSRMYQPL